MSEGTDTAPVETKERAKPGPMSTVIGSFSFTGDGKTPSSFNIIGGPIEGTSDKDIKELVRQAGPGEYTVMTYRTRSIKLVKREVSSFSE